VSATDDRETLESSLAFYEVFEAVCGW